MADPRFDPALHAAKAQQLTDLATRARAASQSDTIARGVRLGEERDAAARAVHAAEQQQAAAEQQIKRELAAAERYEDAASALERKAAAASNSEIASDHREDAATQRALAEVARRRAHSADEEVDRLDRVVSDQREVVTTTEQQLAGETARRAAIESELDQLEWQAGNARGMAESSQKIIDLSARAAAAETRGDNVVAAKLREEVATHKTIVETLGSVQSGRVPDPAVLQQIGITAPEGVFDVPGFPSGAPGAPGGPSSVGAPLDPELADAGEPKPDSGPEVDLLGEDTFAEDTFGDLEVDAVGVGAAELRVGDPQEVAVASDDAGLEFEPFNAGQESFGEPAFAATAFEEPGDASFEETAFVASAEPESVAEPDSFGDGLEL